MNTVRKNKTKALLSLALLALMICVTVVPVFADSIPNPVDFIADEAGILSEATVRTVKNSNEELKNSVGAVIAVCTVSTTGDTPIGEYTRSVFREWKLGESILILIAVDDMDYYFLQSTGIDSVISNSELQEISDEYLENDFVAGNTDTGVMKVAAKLSSVLGTRLPKADAAQPVEENSGSSVGKVIVGFFKVILWIVLIAVVAFVVLFVVAMFNDDVAAFMRKYIFRQKRQNRAPHIEYDERLYGSRPRRPQNGGSGDTTDYSAYYPRTNDDGRYQNRR